MGTPFTYPIELRRSERGSRARLDALVDTGASFTWIPQSVLERLNVERRQRRRFEFADGRSEYYDLGFAWIKLDGWEGLTPVVFGDERSMPLIGCATLDDFSLAVDPVNERLLPVPARE